MREFRDSLIRSEKIFQIGLILVILALSYIVLRQLSFLFAPFLWAVTFYLTLKPIYLKLINKRGWNKHLAATFLVFILLIFILILLGVAYLIINAKVLPLIENPALLRQTTISIVSNLQTILPNTFDVVGYVSKLLPEVANYLLPLIKNIGTILLDTIITGVIFYVLLINNEHLRGFIENILPFKKKSSEGILDKFESLVRGNMISIPLVALTQGLFGFIGYFIFGLSLSNSLIFGFLTAIASIIPVIGTSIVYVPLAAYVTFINAEVFNGIAIFLWGFIVVGFCDNLTRAFFLKKISQISVWYTIIGSVIGIKIFGLSGLIFGPILLILVISLWRLYYDHFGLYRDDYDNEGSKEKNKIIYNNL